MTEKERLDKQIEFLIEADKIKNVFRRTYNADKKRLENSAEHSWRLALLSLILGEHSKSEIDRFKVMSMLVIHDIIEIDAGDTYIYDDKANASKADREKAAADRIFAILPPDQGKELRKLWEEFEKNETNEARFANAMDRFDPVILNDLGDGLSWKEHGVTKTQVMEIHNSPNSPKDDVSKLLFDYKMNILEKNVALGNIIDK